MNFHAQMRLKIWTLKPLYPLFSLCLQRSPLLVDGSYQSLEALPIEHLQIVFVASSSSSEDDSKTSSNTTTVSTSSTTSSTTAGAPLGQQRSAAKKNSTLANGYTSAALSKVQDVKAKARKSVSRIAIPRRMLRKDRESGKKMEVEKKTGVEEEVLDAPPEGWPLRRVISIEEDHLPHLLQGGSQPLLHQLSEEDEEEEEGEEEEAEEASPQTDVESSVALPSEVSSTPTSGHLQVSNEPAKKSYLPQIKKTPLSPRGQPVGKETQQVCPEFV